jgi:anaerobic magnesium-protoporphyrin IX monomethyl ester cyclase
LGLEHNYQKFKKHLGAGGLLYAFWRGIKYLHFLIKTQGHRFKHNPDSIIKGRLNLVYAGGGINIFWNNCEITKSPGLNVSINTLGLWTNSTEADWQLLEKSKDHFKFKVIFWNLPLSQVWDIKINDEQEIDLQIDTEIEEWLHIDECRVVCLANSRYKTWISGYRQGDFPRLHNRWQDLCLDNPASSLIGLRFPIGDEFLPSFTIETQDNLLLPLIQNPPLEVNGHIIAFRRTDPEEKKEYSTGLYHIFSGKINLFKDEHLLDTKIEGLRQSYLKAEIEAKAKLQKSKRALKVLLVNLPWHRNGNWGVRAGSRWPHMRDKSEGAYLPFPFFLAFSASLLQRNNIDATMIDAIAEEIPEDEFLEKILRMDFDYLVAETSIPSFYYDLDILNKIASRGIPVILCGPNYEIYQPRFLEGHPFISFVLFGEYEFTLLELVKYLQAGKDLSKVRGLIYRDNAGIRKNLAREPFDINLLPWPHREGLPMHKYLDAPGEMPTPNVQMLASRGCPFKCQFCLWPQVIYQGNHYRARNVKDVVDEMEYLVKGSGFKSVYFDDDTFNIGKERMLSFCREIRERGLDKTQWAIMARPDLMDGQILENMKKAGLRAVKYGVESATQSLVGNIGKNMDLRKSERMIKLTKELGIRAHLTFTLGLPGETKETIEKTIQYALKLDPFSVQFSITTPFPGTEYYKILEKNNSIVIRDLSCYDGHFKSVIRLENLSPEDLELAKERAYRIWAEHLRKRRGFCGDVKRFYSYSKEKGLSRGLHKTKNYLKYVILDKNKYLNSKV